jgi:signal transduction histidine kinase
MSIHGTVPPRASHRGSIWGLIWRMTLALVFGLGLLLFTAHEFSGLEARHPDYVTPMAVYILFDVVLGVVAFCLLPFRRRAPLTIAITASALGAVSTFGFGAITIVLISLATRRRPKEIALAGTVTVLAAIANTFLLPDPDQTTTVWQNVLFALVYLGICVVIGMYIGGRRELVASLDERARLAETEQAARLQSAQSAERTRIAREMHDVLAHRLSLVAMHSGALAYRDDLTREETASTAAVVRENAQLALSELREVLGVLRDDTGNAARVPQPTLAALPELLEQSEAAGTTVHCAIAPAVHEALQTLPDSTGRNAFRIIQESLTNARRHAHGADVDLDIGGVPGERLTVRLSNPVRLNNPAQLSNPVRLNNPARLSDPARLNNPARLSDPAWLNNPARLSDPASLRDSVRPSNPVRPSSALHGGTTADGTAAHGTVDSTMYISSGLGLPGLVERARLAGGELTHGVTDGRFTVEAWLPWTA